VRATLGRGQFKKTAMPDDHTGFTYRLVRCMTYLKRSKAKQVATPKPRRTSLDQATTDVIVMRALSGAQCRFP
jgi:hypothetical protein